MAKVTTRTGRWAAAVAAAQDAIGNIEAAQAELEVALGDLVELQDEYEEWRDNLPDSLQDGATAEKLDAVVELDLEPDIDDLSGCREAVEAAGDADLPLGFGRD